MAALVSVSPSHDGVDDCFFKVWRVKKLPQGVLECNAHPALLVDVIHGRGFGGRLDALHYGLLDFLFLRPKQDLLVERLRL